MDEHLPTEVWELIFRCCSDADLLTIRVVCRRWWDIVMGCTALRGRITVRFGDIQFLKGFKPSGLPTTVSRAVFFRVDQFEVSSWWPDFGQTLEDLIFRECSILADEMFYLLMHCPKLKRIDFVGVLYGTGRTDFKLESLEEFSVTMMYVWKRPIIHLFGPIFPRLKRFSLAYDDSWKKSDIFNLFKFLQTVQGTLQSLKLPVKIKPLKALAKMDRLLLKEAEFSINCRSLNWDVRVWTQFCQSQREMQDLCIKGNNTSNEALCIAVHNMVKLEKLSCANLASSRLIVPTFLCNLPSGLRNVQLQTDHVQLDFRTQLSPSLKEFRLIRGKISHGIEYLMTSPHIEQLTLQDCDLAFCMVPTKSPTVSSLKHLTITFCKIFLKMLDRILSGHPLLETFRIVRCDTVNVDTILELLKNSPMLKQITLIHCPEFAEMTGEAIMKNYSEMYDLEEGSRDICFTIDCS